MGRGGEERQCAGTLYITEDPNDCEAGFGSSSNGSVPYFQYIPRCRTNYLKLLIVLNLEWKRFLIGTLYGTGTQTFTFSNMGNLCRICQLISFSYCYFIAIILLLLNAD